MCSKRIYNSSSERQAAYRQRKIERGERAPSGKAHKQKSKWKNGYFIGLDGEGESYGEEEIFITDSSNKEYRAQDHRYTLLAASTGESLFSGGSRLKTKDCLNFLLDLKDKHPLGIFVIFAGSYDINHILMHEFPREFLAQIAGVATEQDFVVTGDKKTMLNKVKNTFPVQIQYDGIMYEIQYRPRKCLTIRRGLIYRKKTNGQIVREWKTRMDIWDVWGFFQDNFVTVVDKWLGKDYKHYDLIKEMKAKRGDFANVDNETIARYNAAELESLVEVMEKVRDAIDGLGLECRRWDGAGALAASIMRKENVVEFKGEKREKKNKQTVVTLLAPPAVTEAARCAYAGGRIEVCKIGYHEGPVYDYDINSAYPFVTHGLPCLAHGEWIHGTGEPPQGFTMVHARFDFVDGLPFYPLFYRTELKQILFPAQGEGWYWYPEYEASLAVMGVIDVIEWWHFKPSCDHQPFWWVKDYYQTRQAWVKHATEEWQRGGEKIIKLGLNSLYGKTAQQLGGKVGKPPTYHQLEWAGFITSATRARLFTSAFKRPSDIIGFATDGVFSTVPLDVPCSTKKEFGAWELKEPIPQGMVIAMAGVYWWIMGENNFTHFSRGFDKDAMKTPHAVMDAWKRGDDEVQIPMHRLIGMGTACTSDTFWKMRGRFTSAMRALKLDGDSPKRQGVDVKLFKPHKKLVDLFPRHNMVYLTGQQICSHPYPLKWLEIDDDYETDQELQRENADTENI